MQKSEYDSEVIESLKDAQIEYIKVMPSAFGLNEKPEPLEIKYRKLLGSGLLRGNPGSLVVNIQDSFLHEDAYESPGNFEKWVDSRRFVLAHELSHYLHFLRDPEVFPQRNRSAFHFYLLELVAELGAVHFADVSGFLEKVKSGVNPYSSMDDEVFDIYSSTKVDGYPYHFVRSLVESVYPDFLRFKGVSDYIHGKISGERVG